MQLREDLIRKTQLQRGVHSYYEERMKVIAVGWRIGLLLVPAVIVFVAIADSKILSVVGLNLNSGQAKAIVGFIGWFGL